MSEPYLIKSLIIQERLKPFKPTEYDFLIICITKYDMLTNDDKINAMANAFFERQARRKHLKVLPKRKQDQLKMTADDVTKAKAVIDKEIEDQRQTIIKNYIEQLKNKHPLNDLPACVEDAINFLVYMIKEVGC